MLYVPFSVAELPTHQSAVRHSRNEHENGANPGSSYETLPTPTDSDIMTPLSASSAPYHSPGVQNGHSPQEWNAMAASGYNPYFPVSHGEHGNYSNGIP
jgi:hypothetical protein